MLYADSYKDWSIGRSRPYYGQTDAQDAWVYYFLKGNKRASATILLENEADIKKKLFCNLANRKAPKGVNNMASGYYTIDDDLCNGNLNRESYRWYCDDRKASAYRSFFKPTSVKLPGRVFWAKCSGNYNDNYYRFWHSNNSLMLFVDLSVKSLMKRDIPLSNGEYTLNWSKYPASGSPRRSGF